MDNKQQEINSRSWDIAIGGLIGLFFAATFEVLKLLAEYYILIFVENNSNDGYNKLRLLVLLFLSLPFFYYTLIYAIKKIDKRFLWKNDYFIAIFAWVIMSSVAYFMMVNNESLKVFESLIIGSVGIHLFIFIVYSIICVYSNIKINK